MILNIDIIYNFKKPTYMHICACVALCLQI